MCDEKLRDNLIRRQKEMFRLAERDFDLPQATIARRSGFHANIIGKWARGESAMALYSFIELCAHLPDALTSILFEGANKALRSLETEGCFDELAAECGGYQNTHLTARNDNSPGGPAIVPQEVPDLVAQARRVRDAADRVISKHGGGAS